jgi:hypothetical protein
MSPFTKCILWGAFFLIIISELTHYTMWVFIPALLLTAITVTIVSLKMEKKIW